MSLATGDRLGGYEVVAKIGEGGMGAVYRARDTKLNRDVALKILTDSFASDPDRLARFTREAQTLALLNHPHIAAIYGFEEGPTKVGPYDSSHAHGDSSGVGSGFSRTVHALVMELVEGEDLAQRLTRGAIPIDEAFPIARQIAEALEAAHEQGIIHRDLKPANIKVRPDGTVKVLDFGLAKAVEGSDSRRVRLQPDLSQSPTITSPAMTAAGMILGTAAYMSPEQAKGRPADKRSDLWSFGCVLYEMCTGHRPFEGDDISDTLANVLKSEPDWALLPQGVPPNVHTLLRRCLTKDRSRRLGDAGAARLELEDAAGASGQNMTARGAIPGPKARSANESRFRRAFVAAIGAWAILASGLALWALQPRRPDAPEPSVVRYEIRPPAGTSFGEAPQAPSQTLSPDGKYVAFGAGALDGGPGALWLRRSDALEPTSLPGTGDASVPFWSPDGRFVAFFADRKLKRVAVSGGPVETLAETAENFKGAWNGAGDILFAATGGAGIARVSAAGGPVTFVTTLDKAAQETDHRLPAFLADGRHFLYLAEPGNVLKVGSLDSPETKALGLKGVAQPSYAPEGYVLYVTQQTLVARPFDVDRLTFTGEAISLASSVRVDPLRGRAAYDISNNGVLTYRQDLGRTIDVVWVGRDGKVLSHAAKPGSYRSVEPSPGGELIALRRYDQTTGASLWIVDTSRGTEAPLLASASNELSPRWSPDGKSLVFYSNKNGGGLFLKQVALAAEEELLLDTPTNAAPTDWSADGRVIVYEQNDPTTRGDMWLLPIGGKNPEPSVFLRTKFDEGQGVLSADGRWMAYTSNESERFEVWVQPNPKSGEKWRISTNGGRQPRWRKDGRELFFLDPSGAVMGTAVQDINGHLQLGQPQKLFDSRVGTPAFDTNAAVENALYAVSPDGQRFLLANQTATTNAEPLVVMTNWLSLLRK